MKFLNKIFSSFAKNTYREVCRTMIRSYYKIKQKNPNIPRLELYALALSLRPSWQRENPSSFTFFKGTRKFIIEPKHAFRDVVWNVIFLETVPSEFLNDPEVFLETINEITEVVNEEFKDFKE